MQTLQISPTVITALKVKAVNLLMIALKGNGTAHGCSANLSVLHRLANVRKPELVNLVSATHFRIALFLIVLSQKFCSGHSHANTLLTDLAWSVCCQLGNGRQQQWASLLSHHLRKFLFRRMFNINTAARLHSV